MMGWRNQGPDEPTGAIVGSPTPDESGMVAFTVQVGDGIVVGVAHPCGSGLKDRLSTVDPAIASAVMRVVSLYVEERGDEMLALYREAARLRRGAGNPPLAGCTRRGKVHVVGAPVKLADAGALFMTDACGVRLKVAIYNRGGFDFAEECEYVEAVSEEDRDEAVTVCLDYIFAHPDEATVLGLDVALLDELWQYVDCAGALGVAVARPVAPSRLTMILPPGRSVATEGSW
jgi:hypothetical protein